MLFRSVYNQLFAWKGSFAVAGPDVSGCYVSNEFPCFRIREGQADGRYLHYYFSRESVWNEALGLSSGGTPTSRNRLKEDRLLAMSMPLPPIEEQQRIAAMLDQVNKKVTAIMCLAEGVQQNLEHLLVSLHLRSSNRRLVEMAELVDLHEERVAVEPSCEYPQVGVRGFGGGLFERETLTIGQTTYNHFNRLFAGCLVLSQVKGWEGAVSVCDSRFVGRFVSPEYRTFRCRESALLPHYLAELVKTEWFWSKLATITRGVGARRERTRPEHFLEMRVEMPTRDAQTAILTTLRSIRRASTLRSDLTEIRALVPAMISYSFSRE